MKITIEYKPVSNKAREEFLEDIRLVTDDYEAEMEIE
jgi:hypothetical protein